VHPLELLKSRPHCSRQSCALEHTPCRCLRAVSSIHEHATVYGSNTLTLPAGRLPPRGRAAEIVRLMGKFNSPITRVWPVFDFLMHRDPTGDTWLPGLLRLGQCDHAVSTAARGHLLPVVSARTREIPRNMRSIMGLENSNALGLLRGASEAEFPPPTRFLT
jgi:hypothetical protein